LYGRIEIKQDITSGEEEIREENDVSNYCNTTIIITTI
jgi:hypothetical protein